jgi:predicted regulator of Ras-like GTPase activity (Roadblock/LC7/MglB family)
MKDIFQDVLGIEGVHGVMVISNDGNVMANKFSSKFSHEAEKLSQIQWAPFVLELSGIADAELVFDAAKFYIKKSDSGYLIVIMEDYAQLSMVRLNCEVLLPSLDKLKSTSKRISDILRKKIF